MNARCDRVPFVQKKSRSPWGARAFMVVLLGAGADAQAAEVSRVVSGAAGEGKKLDVNLSAAFFRDARTAEVAREQQDSGTARTTLTRDLIYRQTRNVLGLRADMGLIHDLGIFIAAPLVLSDDRSLSFDRNASECGTLMPGAGSPGCVNESTSSTLRDGVLPGAGAAAYGWDSEHARRFERPSGQLFSGPTRKGLEYLGLGLQWALMNQDRDETKPTWLVRFESRLSVAQDMRFDIESPKANTGVGLGYHQFVFSSVFSRRFTNFDPYVGVTYNVPSTTSGSIYDKYKLGQNGFGGPQQRASLEAGTELAIYENLPARQRVTLELRGRVELRFFGLAQSELWEPLSGSSKCPADKGACRAGIDRDLTGDRALDPNPGITRSPSYGVFGGDFGLNVQAGRYVRFRGLVGVEREQDRFLTDGRSGGTTVDGPGRRFRIENAQTYRVFFEGGLNF